MAADNFGDTILGTSRVGRCRRWRRSSLLTSHHELNILPLHLAGKRRLIGREMKKSKYEIIDTDVLIVGSGCAGLGAALEVIRDLITAS